MPTLRNKVNKRKSDSFVVDNGKTRKIATITETKGNVQVPLTVQFKSLKVAHEALIKVNSDNLKEIEDLKLQVALLVHERSSQKESELSSTESQTVNNECFKCNQCKFESQNAEETQKHMEKEHWIATKSNNFVCNLCSDTFNVRWELMVHKKNEHPLYLKTCSFFLEGSCAFGEECWFKHKPNGQGSSAPQTLKEFKCGVCGQIFQRKTNFREHRKLTHIKDISICKENRNGYCIYGSQECWSKHEGGVKNVESEMGGVKTVELVQRLFDMMEKFAERISRVEN